MSFGDLASDSDTSTIDYVVRADVLDSEDEAADDCEGNGLGADRNINKVDEDPETRTGTVSADCPAGSYTLRVSISSADNTELASASAGFFILRAPVVIEPPTLTALSVSHGEPAVEVELSPAFNSGRLAYEADVTVAQVTIAPTAGDADATVAYRDWNGDAIADADPVVAGHQVDLEAGSNTVRVAVSRDGLITTYTLILFRLVSAQQGVVNICERMSEVQDAILASLGGTATCNTVTDADLARIRELFVTGYSSSTIASGDFAGLPALTMLGIYHSRTLTTLQANALADLTSIRTLRDLDFVSSAVHTVHPGAFAGLTNLERLSLSYNDISTLHPDTFQDVANIQSLSLHHNHIRVFEDGLFDGLSALRTINASWNRFSAIGPGTFSGLSSLTKIVMTGNRISNLQGGAFTSLTALTDLYLDQNDITTLPPGIFTDLARLTELRLNHNPLGSLPANAFEGLTALSYLSIQYCSITSIHQDAFDGLTALRTLILFDNSLTSLPAGVFQDTTKLNRIVLANNGFLCHARQQCLYRPHQPAHAGLQREQHHFLASRRLYRAHQPVQAGPGHQRHRDDPRGRLRPPHQPGHPIP